MSFRHEHFRGDLGVGTVSDNTEADPPLGEVLFEVKVVGNAVKVSALDPVTNTEVCVVGSAHTSAYSLKMNALRKLRSVLRKNTGP